VRFLKMSTRQLKGAGLLSGSRPSKNKILHFRWTAAMLLCEFLDPLLRCAFSCHEDLVCRVRSPT
jgi:hypothetical protein